MIYKGKFYFNGKNHPGECEIDEENHVRPLSGNAYCDASCSRSHG